MSQIQENIALVQEELAPYGAKLIAVTKTHPPQILEEVYNAGLRIFGENKVQEMTSKYDLLPKDIEWHMIGHLQSNKVKYMSPYVFMIQSVDSLRLLREINKQGERVHRVIDCLLQMHIATEETKFGLNESELMELVQSAEVAQMRYVRICGLMGMASFTSNQLQIAKEFAGLRQAFKRVKSITGGPRFEMRELSMGMSSDYQIALNEGSTMVRIGSRLFGARR